MNSINLTLKELKELTTILNNAKQGEVIVYKGQDILREYGLYLIEYLNNKQSYKRSKQ